MTKTLVWLSSAFTILYHVVGERIGLPHGGEVVFENAVLSLAPFVESLTFKPRFLLFALRN